MLNKQFIDLILEEGSIDDKNLLLSILKDIKENSHYDWNSITLLEKNYNGILLEAPDIKAENSNLSHDIWLDGGSNVRNMQHNKPRLKIKSNHDKLKMISIEISENPKILSGKFDKHEDISDILDFIKDNYVELLDLWNNPKDVKDFILKNNKNKKK